MITELRLSNFQGFAGESRVPLAPITVIFGPNSSGKSSLIRSLLLLSQTSRNESQVSPQVAFSGSMVDLGSFTNTVTAHDESKLIGVGFTTRSGVSYDFAIGPDALVKLISVGGLSAPRGRLFEANRERKSKHEPIERLGQIFFSPLESNPLEFRIDEDSFSLNPELGSQIRNYISGLRVANPLEVDADELLTAARNLRFNLQSAMLPSPIRSFEKGGDNLVSDFFGQILREGEMQIRRRLNSLSHLAGLRVIPERFSNAGRATRLMADGGNVQDLLNLTPGLTNKTSDWLQKLTDGRYSLELVPFQSRELAFLGEIGTLALRDSKLGILTTFKDVGTGLSQILPILVTLAKSMISQTQDAGNPFVQSYRRLAGAPLVLLEQPELHLHPRLQGDLADLFIDASCHTSEHQPQIVLETHSENLILRLRRRIREGEIPPEAVSLVYVSRGSDSNYSQVRVLDLDSNGDFKNDWDEGNEFSEIRLAEMF